MLRTIDKRKVRPRNALDVDLKITLLQNVQIRQKITRKVERKFLFMKKLMVHATTAKITATKRYMHLWHVCLAMMNVQVKIIVTVRN